MPGGPAVPRRDSKRRRTRARASGQHPAPLSEIQHALDYIRRQIATGRLRPTINDLVHLLEIRQRQQPTEIVASWYSPTAPQGTCPVCLRPSDPAATQRFRAILQAQHPEAQKEQP